MQFSPSLNFCSHYFLELLRRYYVAHKIPRPLYIEKCQIVLSNSLIGFSQQTDGDE